MFTVPIYFVYSSRKHWILRKSKPNAKPPRSHGEGRCLKPCRITAYSSTIRSLSLIYQYDERVAQVFPGQFGMCHDAGAKDAHASVAGQRNEVGSTTRES